jgi:hypothetical protein
MSEILDGLPEAEPARGIANFLEEHAGLSALYADFGGAYNRFSPIFMTSRREVLTAKVKNQVYVGARRFPSIFNGNIRVAHLNALKLDPNVDGSLLNLQEHCRDFLDGLRDGFSLYDADYGLFGTIPQFKTLVELRMKLELKGGL